MKNSLKLISLYAAIAAIFSLGACDTKSESSETALIKGLRITASQSVDSRTTFNGEASSWVAGDCLNVLISGGNFLSPTAKEFTITDVSKSVFANDQVEINTHSTYQFHAIYPSVEIDATSKVANVEIGAFEQTQQGTLPAHIAKYDPLYGTSESTAERVMIPMQHTAVAICLNIKNATADAISVKSVRISAPKGVAIAGTHSVNIATGEISASDADNATSNTIELSFEQDIELMADASHTAWIATAPFTIANSGLLLFTIIDTYGNEYDIIKSFPTGREFSSGKIISTTLEVSEVAATTKDITIDFSEASTYPEGVATSISAATENITCQIDGYPVNVYSATGCYYSKSNKRLVLINMNTKSDESEFATISIPQLIGYKISSISISISAESASRVIYLCDNQGTILYEKLGQQSPVNFTTDNIASLITDDSQYHLKFTTTASASFGVNNISVSYTRM